MGIRDFFGRKRNHHVPKRRPTKKTVVYHRVENAEETSKMDREDFLIKQIDEIREKAQHLQAQLEYKQSHLNELEESVGEKEGRVKELESVLAYKKEEAQTVIQTAGKQLADVSGRIENKLGELIADVEETLGKNSNISEEQTQAINAKIDEMIHALDDMKLELAEKTHSENVKCFRNVQSSLDDLKEYIDAQDLKEETKGKLRGPGVAAVWLSVINMLLLVGLLLWETGVIGMFL